MKSHVFNSCMKSVEISARVYIRRCWGARAGTVRAPQIVERVRSVGRRGAAAAPRVSVRAGLPERNAFGNVARSKIVIKIRRPRWPDRAPLPRLPGCLPGAKYPGGFPAPPGGRKAAAPARGGRTAGRRVRGIKLRYNGRASRTLARRWRLAGPALESRRQRSAHSGGTRRVVIR